MNCYHFLNLERLRTLPGTEGILDDNNNLITAMHTYATAV